MQTLIWKNIIRFLFLVILQGMALTQFPIPGNLQVFIYILFILLLPYQTPNSILLILSFLLGFCIDFFTGTIGLHTATCTFMGFCRILYFKAHEAGPHENELQGTPGSCRMGRGNFIWYCILLIVCHHVFFFLLEAFSFRHILYTLWLIIGSSILTFLAVMIALSVFRSKE
ncbi:MAG: hypothetical protein RRX93_07260 [Bacteroidales bacterium]